MVNKRATSWLLAALMALCAAQAMPLGRVERSRDTSPIVWTAQVRAEERIAVLPTARHARTRTLNAVPSDFHASSSSFFGSLYQRPPPDFLS